MIARDIFVTAIYDMFSDRGFKYDCLPQQGILVSVNSCMLTICLVCVHLLNMRSNLRPRRDAFLPLCRETVVILYLYLQILLC